MYVYIICNSVLWQICNDNITLSWLDVIITIILTCNILKFSLEVEFVIDFKDDYKHPRAKLKKNNTLPLSFTLNI